MYLKKYKKETKKTQRDTAASSERLHFSMRATFSHLLCLLGVFVRLCVCCNFLLTPASACHVLLLALSFVNLRVCVCFCCSIHAFS